MSANRQQRNFSKVRTFSRDEISDLSDQELGSAIRTMTNAIRTSQRSGEDSHQYEVEFCYLENERQRRQQWSSKDKPARPRSFREDLCQRARSAQLLLDANQHPGTGQSTRCCARCAERRRDQDLISPSPAPFGGWGFFYCPGCLCSACD